MSKQIFVTSTGTDVGKTFISALLVKSMKKYGANCGYFKPVLSGAEKRNSGLWAGDCEYVREIADIKTPASELASYIFEQPVSPHLASEMNNVTISLEKIKTDCEKTKASCDYTVIEGAGGIVCPVLLSASKTILLKDIIKMLNSDIVIVSQSGLGSINSAVLTAKYAQAEGINIKGIILNNFDKNDFMHRDNAKQIERLTGCKVICKVEKNAEILDMTKSDLFEIFG